jgi:hypothetical protein
MEAMKEAYIRQMQGARALSEQEMAAMQARWAEGAQNAGIHRQMPGLQNAATWIADAGSVQTSRPKDSFLTRILRILRGAQ